MIKRRYYTLTAAAKRLECEPDDLVHLGANGELAIYALAKGWRLDLYFKPEEEEPWRILPTVDGSPREVYGPLQLYAETLFRFESDKSATCRRFVAHPSEDFAPEGFYEYAIRDNTDGQQQTDVRVSECSLVIMFDDILAVQQQRNIDIDQPVEWRERATLLMLISALAKSKGIDASHASKAAVVIETLTIENKCRIPAKTIELHLKRIPEALGRRSKE